MSLLTVTTPFNIDLEFRIAPFHKRLLAWLIDMVLIYAYILIIYRYVGAHLHGDLEVLFMILVLYLPAYCYHLLMEIFFNGQSVGKMALGIKVLDMNGNEATSGQYLLRWMLRLVDMAFTMGVGATLAAALSKYGQRMGDMAAGTVVIDKRSKTNITDTIYLELADEYQVVFPEVMHLSDRDINGIRNLLQVKGTSKETDAYMSQVADRIRKVLKIETDLEPRALLQQLLKDYNYQTRK